MNTPTTMKETRAIEIPVYRDPDGKPLCEASPRIDHPQISKGRCHMLDVFYGATFHCKATGERLSAVAWFIRPGPNCPLWKGES